MTKCTECKHLVYAFHKTIARKSDYLCGATAGPEDIVTGKRPYRQCSDVNDGNCKLFVPLSLFKRLLRL